MKGSRIDHRSFKFEDQPPFVIATFSVGSNTKEAQYAGDMILEKSLDLKLETQSCMIIEGST